MIKPSDKPIVGHCYRIQADKGYTTMKPNTRIDAGVQIVQKWKITGTESDMFYECITLGKKPRDTILFTKYDLNDKLNGLTLTKLTKEEASAYML